jgi:hypothetical protein
MTLSISQANDANTVLRYVLSIPGPAGVPTHGKACDAATRLADASQKVLHAGLDGDEVAAAWPDILLRGDDS